MSDESGLVIRHKTLIHASVERVYATFTTAEEMDRWFTQGARIDARPGGTIRFRWVDWGPEHISAEDGGPVLEADRPVRFVFQWHPDEPSYATTVEVDFVPVGNGTVMSLLEHGYPDTPSGRRACLNCAAGWGEALTLLKFYVEHGLRY
jgi:uncharacterized protein YndB with AHSA1/START domain